MRYFILLVKRTTAILVLLFTSTIAFAQPDPMCDPADPYCPIDDYYALLLVAVMLFAAYKAYKRKKTVLYNA